MDDNHGNIKRIQEALNQVMPECKNIASETGNSKEISNSEIAEYVGALTSKVMMQVAIDRLRIELSKDQGENSLYGEWKDNIASAFLSAYEKYMQDAYGDDQIIDRFVIVGIANNAAANFLNQLCSEAKNKQP